MSIVPLRSLPLFAFANDGSIAWLRSEGSRLVKVDARTGEVLRHVELAPAPFGIAWTVERVGGFFVVKDDREIAAYDGDAGTRLWKRSGPTRVAFVGERGARHVTIAPGPVGIEILETDLFTGESSRQLEVEGSMSFIGPHGTLTGDLLVFATDEREVVAIDTSRWCVLARHTLPGSYALPPIATGSGVHVALVERRSAGAVTHVATLDGATGALVSTHELSGAAHTIRAGSTGVVLELKRGAMGMLERVAFRPHSPHIRIAIAKNVDVTVATPRRMGSARPAPPLVEILPASTSAGAARGGQEIPPPAGVPQEGRRTSSRDGFLTLLELMRVRSTMLVRLVDQLTDDPEAALWMDELGLRLRDPRVRWSARPGRDPCLVDLAIDGAGDTLATYWYPAARLDRLPVVRVEAKTHEARWVADDFDDWFAGHLHERRVSAPDLTSMAQGALGLPADLVRPRRATLPPSWFFEAHGTRWTRRDVAEALADGDRAGAERMLVALGRTGHAGEVKNELADLYATLGWGHHRAVVTETW